MSQEWINTILPSLQDWWDASTQHLHTLRTIADWWGRKETGSNLVIVAVLVMFWPLLFSLIMFFVTAGTWLFWLATSILLGILQMGYATYHFCMIAIDIFGLSLLKSYSVIRHQFVQMVEAWTSSLAGRKGAFYSFILPYVCKLKKSRRRKWRQEVNAAATYEDFLKIRIQKKDESGMTCFSKLDMAMPPSPQSQQTSKDVVIGLGRHNSFSSERELHLDSPGRMPRRHSGSMFDNSPSYGGESSRLDPNKSHMDPRIVEELGQTSAQLLMQTTSQLKNARQAVKDDPSKSNIKALHYLLSGVVKRNHLNLDDLLVDNARTVAQTGEYGLTAPTRQVIRKYYDQVEAGINFLAEFPNALAVSAMSSDDRPSLNSLSENGGVSPLAMPYNNNSVSESKRSEGEGADDRYTALSDSIMLVRKMKQNMGRTALMLSGGGAQAMYHSGLIRSLIESKLYDDIKVVSGTSGGSILAATPDELIDHVCVSNVSTDYLSNGEMRKQNIRWFPKPLDMATYWLKHKLLVDSAEFRRTCEFYYGSITFEEAFERTGKHVCITVSASRASGRSAQRLLLNHISTPHVTIASAVGASCALPGVMAPTKLIAKTTAGNLEPFEVDGVEWIDGSVQADLPFQRIAVLFAVSNFIVSQTNFHIVPFLNKAHHPHSKSLYWRLFQTLEWDIRSRALKLSRLGLFPQFFGQDISKVFKQRYYGNLTIVPRFTTMQTIGLKVLANPTVKEMEGYLKYGQIATWPHLNAIRDMLRLERALDDCLKRLEERLRTIHNDPEWSLHDDIDSIASSSALLANGSKVRIIGQPGSRDGSSSLYQRINHLREENHDLKVEIRRLREQLENSPIKSGDNI